MKPQTWGRYPIRCNHAAITTSVWSPARNPGIRIDRTSIAAQDVTSGEHRIDQQPGQLENPACLGKRSTPPPGRQPCTGGGRRTSGFGRIVECLGASAAHTAVAVATGSRNRLARPWLTAASAQHHVERHAGRRNVAGIRPGARMPGGRLALDACHEPAFALASASGDGGTISRLRILPVAPFGSSSTNQTCRGYLYAATFDFT